ncbi:hypothetical protein [Nocardioides sp.]|uniref:hypothetical protein n=1 Tax=Nocardioides sp. TaxID=35761 RepID=UPI0027374A93|nr:hypothetical protein [Nocardioides sp.]MDP3889834.1 hypothetical protein [Nocardioides sp.]
MSQSSQLSPMEELLMIKVGMVALGVAAGALTISTWHRILAWLVDHDVLLPAADSPLVGVPGGEGVGLDASRLAIATAVLLFLIVCGVAAIRQRLNHRAEEIA